METPLQIQNSITILAPATFVWEVLTSAKETPKYMFGCETVSDWKVGSQLIWQANYEGKLTVFVSGNILHFEPPHLLIYTTFDPNSAIPDIPENHLTVTYLLEEENGITRFTVTQGDYSKVADGERRYNDSLNGGEGWNPILNEIKKIAEANFESSNAVSNS